MSGETKIPSNHVVGVIGGSKSAETAVVKLRRAGYEEVLVMHRVDGAGEGVNPLSALVERLAGHLSDETGFLDQYKEAAEKGDAVVAVGAEQGAPADKARDILELEGAVNVRYFGRLVVTDMTPNTNPSASSDEVPHSPRGPESG
jgi:hypothetical protein